MLHKLLKHSKRWVQHMFVSLMHRRKDIMIKLEKSQEIIKVIPVKVDEEVSHNHNLKKVLIQMRYSICFLEVVSSNHMVDKEDSSIITINNNKHNKEVNNVEVMKIKLQFNSSSVNLCQSSLLYLYQCWQVWVALMERVVFRTMLLINNTNSHLNKAITIHISKFLETLTKYFTWVKIPYSNLTITKEPR